MIRPPKTLLLRIGLPVLAAEAFSAVVLAAVLINGPGSDDSLISRAETERIIFLTAGAFLFCALVTVVVLFAAGKWYQGTINRLARSATRFAEGDLKHRIIRPSSKELTPLSEALNLMAARLNEHLTELDTRTTELETILQSMSSGVIALDQQQRVLNMNSTAEKLLGIKLEAARNRLLQEIIRDPKLHRFIVESGNREDVQTEIFLMPGREEPIYLRASCCTLQQADKDPLGMLLLLEDITQLQKLERLRSDFGAAVSHELRTPITNIQGYVETLLEVGMDDREQARRFLEVIRNNSSRLKAIVEDTLALTRLEQTGPSDKSEWEVISVASLVNSVLNQYTLRAESENIEIKTDIPDDCRVRGMRQLLEQALGNLVSNAISYSPADTTITISCSRSENEVVISIRDEGVGIAGEHLPRIFERFYRVDKGRSREHGGTGLGLAIVKHIMLLHGGRAEVSSEPGRGSVFRLVLPQQQDPG